MGEPQRNSRKGLVLAVSRIWRSAERDWLCYRGDWQPNAAQLRSMRLAIRSMRVALDNLEEGLRSEADREYRRIKERNI